MNGYNTQRLIGVETDTLIDTGVFCRPDLNIMNVLEFFFYRFTNAVSLYSLYAMWIKPKQHEHN